MRHVRAIGTSDSGGRRSCRSRAAVTTAVAALEMTAESGGAAHLDRGHDAQLSRGERRAMLFTIGFTVTAKDVRYFQLRAIHVGRWLEMLGWSGLDLRRNRAQQQIRWARCLSASTHSGRHRKTQSRSTQQQSQRITTASNFFCWAVPQWSRPASEYRACRVNDFWVVGRRAATSYWYPHPP
jgi:hypothetical protein